MTNDDPNCTAYIKKNFSEFCTIASFLDNSKVPLTVASLKRFSLNDLAVFKLIAPDLLLLECTPYTNDLQIKFQSCKLSRKRKSGAILVDLIKSRCERFSIQLDKLASKHRNLYELIDNNWKSVLPEGIMGDVSMECQTIPEAQANYLAMLESQPFYNNEVVGYKSRSGNLSKFGTYELAVDTNALLNKFGITSLYCHQTDALQALRENKNIIVTTSTSSGKSICYQLAILEALLLDQETCSLLIFPTKALAQDQHRSLNSFCDSFSVSLGLAIYDGDVPAIQRGPIRTTAKTLFTNPDMLHLSILPNHLLWKRFLSRLKFIVLDEFHYYSGQLGGHTSWIIRRLLRICHHYQNHSVQLIVCSATLTNAASHFIQFFGQGQVVEINQDGSPQGLKELIIWNPAFKTATNGKIGREFAITDMVKIVIQLVKQGSKTIVFARTRQSCEIAINQLMLAAKKLGPGFASKILAYRGGYTPSERRAIEKNLFEGNVLAVVATSALEVGMDIGCLDVVVHLGMPSSVSSYVQQAGRCGRRNTDSCSILICQGGSMIDQHYAKQPDLLLECAEFSLTVDFDDEAINEAQLSCAAGDLSLTIEDYRYFHCASKKEFLESMNACLRYDVVKEAFIPDAIYRGNPAAMTVIRSIQEDNIKILDSTTFQVIETVERFRAPFEIYISAVLLHQGRPYIIHHIDLENLQVYAKASDVYYITVPRDKTHYQTETLIADFVHRGPVKGTTTIFGYHKTDPKTFKILDSFETPHVCLHSDFYGVWKPLSKWPIQAVHALGHTIFSLLPLFFNSLSDLTLCCLSPTSEFVEPRLMIVASSTSAIGRAKIDEIARSFPTFLKRAKAILESCECVEGCNSCIHLCSCKYRNDGISKQGAIDLAQQLYSTEFKSCWS